MLAGKTAQLAGLIALAAVAMAGARAEVAEYTAVYEVEYKGRRVADAEFRVARDEAGDRYVFSSSTKARLLLRLASPNPAVERSVFRVEADRIVPVRFEFEDGSRSGDDNYRIEFDGAAGRLRILASGPERTLPFETGLLDRGSLQVALMRDLARCAAPGPYRLVDDDGIDVYRYERLDDRPVDTGIGTITTARYRQAREGSSRVTILFVAPELAYLPVRIEQMRDGVTETVFSLEALDGLEPRPSGC